MRASRRHRQPACGTLPAAVVVVAVALSAAVVAAERTAVTVCASTAPPYSYNVCEGSVAGFEVAASGWYDNSYATRGFGELFVTSIASQATRAQAYAAGFVEGYLTTEAIAHLNKRVQASRSPATASSTSNFVTRQVKFLREEAAKHAAAEASPPQGPRNAATQLLLGPVAANAQLTWAQYWRLVEASLLQVDGVLAGYLAARSAKHPGLPALTITDMLLLNYDGDLMDVAQLAEAGVTFGSSETLSGTPRFTRQRTGSLVGRKSGMARSHPSYSQDDWVRLSRHGRCSAMIAASKGSDRPDVFSGHTSWSDYSEMVRVYKHYALPFHGLTSGAVGASMSFSSYPGMVTSTDDWYTLSSGLLVTETSLSAAVPSALSRVTPEASVPSWIRVSIANRVAATPQHWATIFALFNGGTYNCAWMVVDNNKVVQAQRAAVAKATTAAGAAARTAKGKTAKAKAQAGSVGGVSAALLEVASQSDAVVANAKHGTHATATATAAAVMEFSAQGQSKKLSGNGGVSGCGCTSTTPRSPWLAGLSDVLWLVEQSPVRVVGQDSTALLACQGYFFSVNRPFFPVIRADLLYPHNTCTGVPLHEYYSYGDNPRGRVLARAGASLRTEAQLQTVLRANRYTAEPLTHHEPYLAVAARFDLAPVGAKNHQATGGTDTKTTNAADAMKRSSRIVVGPTTDGVPPFDWRTWLANGRREDGLGVSDMCDVHGSGDALGLPCKWEFTYSTVTAPSA